MDRLSYLLDHLNVSAGVFFTGQLCGLTNFEEKDVGHIHVLRSGTMEVIGSDKQRLSIDEPSMIFSTRSHRHQLVGQENNGAELVCASVRFQTVNSSPVVDALPALVTLPLASVRGLDTFIEVLFAEADAQQEGSLAVMNRLMEVIFVAVLRHIISEGESSKGMLAALADPHLNRVLSYIGEQLNGDLSVEHLANIADMSRSSFIQHFKSLLSASPGEFVQHARITAAKKLILKDKPMSVICHNVGYDDASGFSRAFKKNTGITPREWKKLHLIASSNHSKNLGHL
ncbi:AraC family transcriptional regulator [Spongiibacter sp. UBA1325]|uniref:AraC family transcriptional regulator n=1 Tax=Spongiibacter sp. UBA1325 TaxID=1947543 RepID=UPI00257C42C6|nr:AraC family transcriptional regulator [Spongiibacter sp. UBA1325]|tara:strand:+ start:20340 stop:21197 length:858 start_codon:yes stop_codon:yes gene_type:complete